ncbi:hypothetical protein AB9E14_08425 [Rhizobium leguminosarum]|uniref:hypothetical protein n=1 Tax=Rhizobium leguminosarum TaxID=384 RepID=UPI00102F931D|nr:hypothetical protein [Rhizobium leguminosarum]QIO76213.1 hypothetical protein HA459_29855 [Rhizobium leguminosarum bv. trifolii]QIO83230.1 hypothetical protein HA460_29890 [Rhizobium leguminosarum bv. trifolii]TAU16517.1 hypothetical protein ELI50_27380 [Rhizobium leguminosarum]TAU34789.1 hypothetical protein ELI51_32805 [Rhizobium leguminosarum]TAX44033.1 hypothetical protein ELH99_31780 [Rhizobium leguminosarum]
MPPGDYNLNATLGLIETTANQPIILQGAGRGATRFIIQHTNHWVRLGDRAAAVESKNIEIRDCTFLGNVAQDSAHAAFVCEKISLYRLRNVEIVGAAADFFIGNPNIADDAKQGNDRLPLCKRRHLRYLSRQSALRVDPRHYRHMQV